MKDVALPLSIMVGMAVVWFVWKEARQPNFAENEERVHAYMVGAGATSKELCAHAKVVEQGYARSGDLAKAGRWAELRRITCLNADLCAQLIGGCASDAGGGS